MALQQCSATALPVITFIFLLFQLFDVATVVLTNRFKLILMASLWADGDIIFSSCGAFVLLPFSSANLSRRTLDVYHTSTHGVAVPI